MHQLDNRGAAALCWDNACGFSYGAKSSTLEISIRFVLSKSVQKRQIATVYIKMKKLAFEEIWIFSGTMYGRPFIIYRECAAIGAVPRQHYEGNYASSGDEPFPELRIRIHLIVKTRGVDKLTVSWRGFCAKPTLHTHDYCSCIIEVEIWKGEK